MLKRLITFMILICCFLLISVQIARADLILPPDNDFYERYKSQCIYLGRSFTVNSADGFVSVQKEPGSPEEMTTLENGEIIYVEYSCFFNGDFWGITSFLNSDKNSDLWRLSGWVKMDQLLVLYDYVAFEEDHPGEFYIYDGDYEAIRETGAMIAWAWPGSGTVLWTVEDVDTENFYVLHAYMDEEGREWGFVTYFYGSRDIWVCLSDPLNRDIPAFNPDPGSGPWESETVHTEILETENWQAETAPEDEFPLPVLIIILVALLVIGTVVLIWVFWKPNKGGSKTEG